MAGLTSIESGTGQSHEANHSGQTEAPFNAEHQHTRKKSIDLEFIVWNVWLVLRSVAVKRFLKRLFSD